MARERKKAGGRQKGTPNKTTATNREMINTILEDKRAEFEKRLKSLDDKSYVDAYIKLLAFAVPKLKAVDLTTKGEQLNTEPQPIILNISGDAKSLK